MRQLLAIVALSLVLAGCAGAADPKSSASLATTAPPPSVTADTGSIEALVTDDEQKPVTGVTVGLVETGAKETSDATGKVVFNNLTAGTYKLVTDRLGYESVARSVDVVVGEVSQVEIMVRPVAIAPQGIVEMTPFKGMIQCGVTPEVMVTPCGGVTGEEKHHFMFPVRADVPYKEAVFELVWKPSVGGTGEELELQVCDDVTNQDVPCLEYDYWKYKNGPSPLVVRLSDLPVKKQQMFTAMVGAAWVGDGGSVVVQQAFDLYISLCYVEECAEEYTALPPP